MNIYYELKNYNSIISDYERNLSNVIEKRLIWLLQEDLKCNVYIGCSQYVRIIDSDNNQYFIDFHFEELPFRAECRYSKGSKTRHSNKTSDISERRYRQIRRTLILALESNFDV